MAYVNFGPSANSLSPFQMPLSLKLSWIGIMRNVEKIPGTAPHWPRQLAKCLVGGASHQSCAVGIQVELIVGKQRSVRAVDREWWREHNPRCGGALLLRLLRSSLPLEGGVDGVGYLGDGLGDDLSHVAQQRALNAEDA